MVRVTWMIKVENWTTTYQSSFSSKEMMDYYTVKTGLDSKMMSNVGEMKLKYRLRQKEVFEVLPLK